MKNYEVYDTNLIELKKCNQKCLITDFTVLEFLKNLDNKKQNATCREIIKYVNMTDSKVISSNTNLSKKFEDAVNLKYKTYWLKRMAKNAAELSVEVFVDFILIIVSVILFKKNKIRALKNAKTNKQNLELITNTIVRAKELAKKDIRSLSYNLLLRKQKPTFNCHNKYIISLQRQRERHPRIPLYYRKTMC